MVIRKYSLLPFSIAAALLVVSDVTFSIAQTILPPNTPLAEDREKPLPPKTAPQPGYLGLIGDDRRDKGAGVRVVSVAEGAPAAEAGLVVGDLIIAIDGKPVGSVQAMAAQLQPHTAGEQVRFEVRRGDELREIDVTLGIRPLRAEQPFEFGPLPAGSAEPPAVAPPDELVPPLAPSSVAPHLGRPLAARGQLLGIRTGVVTQEVRRRLGLPRPAGARVVSRTVGSPAEQAGIPLEAVIVAVDDQPVSSPVDLARLIEAAGPGKEIELAYYAGGEQRSTRVRLAAVGESPADPRRPARPLDELQNSAELADRIEQLERRIRDLEERLEKLESAQSAGGR
jgi:predicted metalloprotease with PDZ domain